MDAIKEIKNQLFGIWTKEQSIKLDKENLYHWCRRNKKELKLSMPKKNKMYLIKDINNAFRSNPYFLRDVNLDEEFFFKCTDDRFYPERDICTYRMKVYSKGQIYDSNNKLLTSEVYNEQVDISMIEEVVYDKKRISFQTSDTMVYVMIDKNTGFYKIGRSRNPIVRERTLQSEKPTIEMVHCYSAKVYDEKALHDEFKDKRVRGEWFDLSGSDISKINAYFENK